MSRDHAARNDGTSRISLDGRWSRDSFVIIEAIMRRTDERGGGGGGGDVVVVVVVNGARPISSGRCDNSRIHRALSDVAGIACIRAYVHPGRRL